MRITKAYLGMRNPGRYAITECLYADTEYWVGDPDAGGSQSPITTLSLVRNATAVAGSQNRTSSPGRLGEGGLALDAAGRGGQRILTSPVDFSNSVERSGEPGDGAAAVAR